MNKLTGSNSFNNIINIVGQSKCILVFGDSFSLKSWEQFWTVMNQDEAGS